MKITLRSKEISRMRNRLETFGFPRLRMMLLVAITGGAGFVASYGLLQLGFAAMSSRYLVASCVAYLTFLFLLWLWLRTSAEDYLNPPDLTGTLPESSGSTYQGHGGHFGGGGSSGSFDGANISNDAPSDHVGNAITSAAEAEEFAIPLILIIFFATLLFSSLFIIYSAPVLFAELLVDGVLAVGLYGRLRRIDSPHWINTALRHTFRPFAVTAFIAFISGLFMEHYAPHAQSVGDVMLLISSK